MYSEQIKREPFLFKRIRLDLQTQATVKQRDFTIRLTQKERLDGLRDRFIGALSRYTTRHHGSPKKSVLSATATPR